MSYPTATGAFLFPHPFPPVDDLAGKLVTVRKIS